MATFLLILRIIGIVLISLVCLVIGLLATVLFVSVRYRIIADRPLNDELTAKANVSFLLHIISATVGYDRDIDYGIRIFGIKVYPKKKKEETVKEDETISASGTDEAAVTDDTAKRDESGAQEEAQYTVDWNESGDDEISDQINDREDEGFWNTVESFIDKISDKYKAFSDKIDKIRFKIRFYDRMRNDDGNKRAVGYIKERAIKLLKKIAPRTVKGFVHFGFDDPATTGKILMYLAIVYPILPRKLTIDPGFTDTDIYGNIRIKGHFSLITPAVCFLGIYFNRDVRRMRRLFKKYKDRVS